MKPNEELLTEDERAAVAELVRERGERGAAMALTLAPPTVLRIIAGRSNIRRGTVLVLRQALATLKTRAA